MRSPLHADVARELLPAIRRTGVGLERWARARGISYTLAWQWTRGLCVPRRAEHIDAVVEVTGIPRARFESYDAIATQPPWGVARLNDTRSDRHDRPLILEHRPGCPRGLECECLLTPDDLAMLRG